MKSLRRIGLVRLSGWARVFGANTLAREWLETARREYPDDVDVLVSLAFLFVQEGRRREALALFERAAQTRPSDAELWFNVGYLNQSLANHDAAIEAFERALAIAANHDRALYGLGLSLISLRRLDEAVVALERNTKLQPMSPYGWYQLGRAQFDRGQRERAEAIIAHLNRFEPKVAAQLARDTGLPPPPKP